MNPTEIRVLTYRLVISAGTKYQPAAAPTLYVLFKTHQSQQAYRHAFVNWKLISGAQIKTVGKLTTKLKSIKCYVFVYQ